MSKKEKVKADWVLFLELSLIEFRRRFPDDERSDQEIIDSFMGFLVQNGIITKNSAGKYVLPELTGTLPEDLRRLIV